jgi:peptidoglycan-N-acetylglucosamine deacetylase
MNASNSSPRQPRSSVLTRRSPARSITRGKLLCSLFISTLIPVCFALLFVHDGGASERVTTYDTFDTEEPYIALTFDVTFDRGDGAHILDILLDRDVPATFAVTGVWALQNPDLMQRIVDEGHTLMNHTWDHPSFTGEYTGSMIHAQTPPLTAEQIIDQVERTDQLVQEQVGVEMRPYIRPPYGDYDDATLAALADAGYSVNVMWTVDTLGWYARPVAEVQQRALDAAQPGANILMHVGHGSTDGAALPGIIDGLRERGYSFATVHDFVEGFLGPSAELVALPETSMIHAGEMRFWWRLSGPLQPGLRR